MKYLLDTCLLSELIKTEPHANVIEWINSIEESSCYISAITIGEIQQGISKLATSKKKVFLQSWLDNDLLHRFHGRIIDPNIDIISIWGRMLGEHERKGNKLPIIDSLIAASAISHGLIVATRNTKDLIRCEAQVFNPWKLK